MKCTDRVFLRYGIGNTGEIPTEYRPKIPNWYTTLVMLPITRYHKYARVGTYVPHTNTRMICCVHACTGTGTNTANLSKPTACMNRSIASTLPRTWQDINNSLDPTTASNWRLSSIKRYNSESRPSTPPLPSQPSSFH